MLSIDNLSIRYGKITAVKDVSFSVNNGEIVGLVGNNGSGKTSIISSIMQSIPNATGCILLYNKNIKKSNHFKEYIGYLPEDVDLYNEMTGFEFLSFIQSFRKMDSLEYKNKYIDEFHLEPILQRKIGTYSKGNKQKLAIVAAMMHNPSLLILDEPFDGLDPASIEKFRRILKSFVNENHSILLCCHALELILEICDRVIVLNKGEITRVIEHEELVKTDPQILYNFFVEEEA